MNPNFVFLGYDTRKNESTGQYETVLVMDKYTILPIIPSISYTRKFWKDYENQIVPIIDRGICSLPLL